MALPKISISDRQVILLNGFETVSESDGGWKVEGPSMVAVIIADESSLRRMLDNDNDAIAFGYVAGRWVAAA